MRHTLPLLLALLATGCGWSDLEAEFFAVAPGRAELSLSAPSARGTQALSSELGVREDALGASRIYASVIQTAGEVNAVVDALCGVIDTLRESGLPPTSREADALTWGPFDDRKHPGLQAKVVMRREIDRFVYELQWGRKGQPESFAKVISGEFFGERARGGHGGFVLDAAQAQAIGVADPKSPDGLRDIARVELTYDMTEGKSRATLRFIASNEDSAAIDYEVEPSGAGWMNYRWIADIVETPSGNRETLLVETRWLASKAGYAAATVSGGDLGAYTGQFAECWSEEQVQIYWAKSFDCGLALRCGEGRVEECVLAPAQAP